jgi:hypothetical protein
MTGFFKSRASTLLLNAISANSRFVIPNFRKFDLTALVLIIGYVTFAVSACSVTSWKSTFGRDHPLIGRIWDVSSAAFIERQSLVTRLARADFILLGTHLGPGDLRINAAAHAAVDYDHGETSCLKPRF